MGAAVLSCGERRHQRGDRPRKGHPPRRLRFLPEFFDERERDVVLPGYDGSSGSELWKSDGTSAGTVQVRDIRPNASSAFPGSLTNVSGTLYFQATEGLTVLSVEERRHQRGDHPGPRHPPGRGRCYPDLFDERERGVVIPGQ